MSSDDKGLSFVQVPRLNFICGEIESQTQALYYLNVSMDGGKSDIKTMGSQQPCVNMANGIDKAADEK